MLGGLLAVIASACSRSSDDGSSDGASGNTGPTSGTSSTTGLPDPSTPTTTSTSGGEQAAAPPGDAPIAGLSTDPFSFGIASGDPDATSVVLWTRLDGLELPESVPLLVEVSDEEDFGAIRWRADVAATIDDGHSVRVIADGFGPGERFFYRFRVDEFVSATGRAITTPTGPDPVVLAVSSCQLFETGRYGAHREIAESDADIVVWLGDFIYEGGGFSELDGRAHTGGEPVDLAGYRDRYAQYLSDADLRSARAAHPWVATWDDHEVVNDYRANVDPVRRAAAQRAWWENIPTRLGPPGDAGLDVYRTVDLGPAGRVLLLDVRQYATGPQATEPSLLGNDQWSWLRAELSEPDDGWTVIASPTLVGGLTASLSGDEPLLDYTFGAYPAERAELLSLLDPIDGVVVSGDLHAGIVLDVKPEIFGPESTSAAPEFMAPAISSAFPDAFASAAPLLPLLNTHVRFIDIDNGFLRLEVGDEVTADYRHVDDVANAASTISTRARFRVEKGNPIPIAL